MCLFRKATSETLLMTALFAWDGFKPGTDGWGNTKAQLPCLKSGHLEGVTYLRVPLRDQVGPTILRTWTEIALCLGFFLFSVLLPPLPS